MFNIFKKTKISDIKKIIQDVEIVEKSESHVAYDCGNCFYVKLEKGGVISDHTHEHEETVYLMEGEAEAIIGNDIKRIKAPAKLVIPSNVYHKFTALTDVIGLEIK